MQVNPPFVPLDDDIVRYIAVQSQQRTYSTIRAIMALRPWESENDCTPVCTYLQPIILSYYAPESNASQTEVHVHVH